MVPRLAGEASCTLAPGEWTWHMDTAVCGRHAYSVEVKYACVPGACCGRDGRQLTIVPCAARRGAARPVKLALMLADRGARVEEVYVDGRDWMKFFYRKARARRDRAPQLPREAMS